MYVDDTCSISDEYLFNILGKSRYDVDDNEIVRRINIKSEDLIMLLYDPFCSDI